MGACSVSGIVSGSADELWDAICHTNESQLFRCRTKGMRIGLRYSCDVTVAQVYVSCAF